METLATFIKQNVTTRQTNFMCIFGRGGENDKKKTINFQRGQISSLFVCHEFSKLTSVKVFNQNRPVLGILRFANM